MPRACSSAEAMGASVQQKKDSSRVITHNVGFGIWDLSSFFLFLEFGAWCLRFGP